MKLLVAGPEGTGTTAMAEMISLHPGVEEAIQFSIPLGSGPVLSYRDGKRHEGPEVERSYLHLHEAKDGWGKLPILIMVRDDHFTKKSQERRGLHKEDPPSDSLMARRVLANSLLWNEKVVFCSYEALAQWGYYYFQQVLRDLGLDGLEFGRVKFNWRNESEKYYG